MNAKFVICFFAVLACAYSQEMDCSASDVEEHVFYPHPTDCSLFYECGQGVPHLQQCMEGLHFNPTLNVCDYPYDAGCTAEGFIFL